jgi:hypothetical protein
MKLTDGTIVKYQPLVVPNGPSRSGSHYLSTWRLCPRLWFWQYGFEFSGLMTRRTAPALSLGILVHAGIAAHLVGQSTSDAMDQVDISTVDGVASDIRQTAKALVTGYITHYQHDPVVVWIDNDGPVVEREYVLDLGHGHEFTSRVDSVRNLDGFASVYEIKTTSPQFMGELKSQFRYSTQVSGEYAVLRTYFPDVYGSVVADIINKGAGRGPNAKTLPFERTMVSRTAAQLASFAEDARTTFDQIDQAMVQYADANAESMRMFPATGQSHGACSRYNRDCEFFNLCQNPDRIQPYLCDYDRKSETLQDHARLHETKPNHNEDVTHGVTV